MIKNKIRITENELRQIINESINKVLSEDINNITPLSINIQNNQISVLETLGEIVDELRKVRGVSATKKWNPTIALSLKKDIWLMPKQLMRLVK